MVLGSILTAAAQPAVQWITTLGSDMDDWAKSVVQTDDGGFAVGGTWNYNETMVIGDFYLGKFDADGNELFATYYAPNTINEGQSIIQSSDGGFVIAGHSGDPTATYAHIAKFDASGVLSWGVDHGGPPQFSVTYGNCVIETSDGGFMVAGDAIMYGTFFDDLYMVKTNSTGQEEWDRIFGGQWADLGASVQQTADGGYILAGSSSSYGAGAGDLWLVKTTSTGFMEWNTTFGNVTFEQGFCVDQTADGGYVILGTDNIGMNYQAYLVKTDALGNEEWSHHYGGEEYEGGYHVRQTDDGGYVFCGATETYGTNFYDIWVVKTDASGNIEWEVVEGLDFMNYGYCIEQCEDGGYIVCGSTIESSLSKDILLMRLEPDTTPALSVTLTPYNPPIYIPETGGSFDYNIELSNQNTFAVQLDFWIMVTLPSGNEFGPLILVEDFGMPAMTTIDRDRTQQIPGNAPEGLYTYHGYIGTYPDIIVDESSFEFEKEITGSSVVAISQWTTWGEEFRESDLNGSIAILDEHALLTINPNPFNPTTTIGYQLSVGGEVNLTVYDASGREVARLVDSWREAGTHAVIFDGRNLASGLYIYRLTVEDFSATGKMVLMK
jgi:hypothetical protein